MYKLYRVTFDLMLSTGNQWLIKASSAEEVLRAAWKTVLDKDNIKGSRVEEIGLKDGPQIIKFIPGVSDV